MGKPVGEFLAGVSAKELAEWLEYFRQEPPEEERADARWAIFAAMYANMHRDPETTSEWKPADFLEMLPWRSSASSLDADDVDLDMLRTKIMGIHAMLSGG